MRIRASVLFHHGPPAMDENGQAPAVSELSYIFPYIYLREKKFFLSTPDVLMLLFGNRMHPAHMT